MALFRRSSAPSEAPPEDEEADERDVEEADERDVEEAGKASDAAETEGDERYIRFAAELMVHAQLEEEVLYPAAILVGEYLKLKLPQPARV